MWRCLDPRHLISPLNLTDGLDRMTMLDLKNSVVFLLVSHTSSVTNWILITVLLWIFKFKAIDLTDLFYVPNIFLKYVKLNIWVQLFKFSAPFGADKYLHLCSWILLFLTKLESGPVVWLYHMINLAKENESIKEKIDNKDI